MPDRVVISTAGKVLDEAAIRQFQERLLGEVLRPGGQIEREAHPPVGPVGRVLRILSSSSISFSISLGCVFQ